MKKGLINALKFAVLAALGVYIIYKLWTGMTPEQQDELLKSIKEADYLWVILSVIAAILSHVSRAARWNLMLNALGYRPKLINSFYAVMGGYLINMAVPRGGEAARAGVITRFEKVPFKHSLGTIIAERALDFVILMSVTATAFFLNFKMLYNAFMFRKNEVTGELEPSALNELLTTKTLIILAVAGIIGLIGLYFIIKKTKFGDKVKDFLMGLLDGLKSILKLEKKWQFLGHTTFIWLMYGFMFYICFFAFDETSGVSAGAVLTGFVMGSFAILVIPGGIGTYPVAIQVALASDLPNGSVQGQALGWVIWASQTVLNLVVGGLSLILVQNNPEANYDDESSDTPESETAQP